MIYVVSPVDLIPDTIPGLGVIDDAAVISWVFHAVADEIENYKKMKRNNIMNENTLLLDATTAYQDWDKILERKELTDFDDSERNPYGECFLQIS